MNVFKPAWICYVAVCVIAILLPASEGYNVIQWKLLVGQLYAIPVFIVALIVTVVVKKRKVI
jgi:predicted transporter